MRRSAQFCAAFLALAASPAAAHPHVFIDSRVGFRLDDAGRLAALEIAWRFEPFYSALILAELGLDPVAEPDAEGLAAVAALQPGWALDFGGEGVLSRDGAPLDLGPPQEIDAGFEDGALVIRFARALADPTPARGARFTAEIYDPEFFVAYTLIGSPAVTGAGAEACRTYNNPFNPMGEATDLLASLFALGPDETPDDPNVGALFADKALLTCG